MPFGLPLRTWFLYLLLVSCGAYFFLKCRRESWHFSFSSSSSVSISNNTNFYLPLQLPSTLLKQITQATFSEDERKNGKKVKEDGGRKEMVKEEGEESKMEKSSIGKSNEKTDRETKNAGDRTRNKVNLPSIPPPEERYWFMKGGKKNPRKDDIDLKLWPEEDPNSDRIVDQLLFVPKGHKEEDEEERGDKNQTERTLHPPLKKILLYGGLESWSPLTRPGRDVFLSPYRCPVSTCILTNNRSEAETADAVIFAATEAQSALKSAKHLFRRPKDQVWILYFLESPFLTPDLFPSRHIPGAVYNWTATYRKDSDIVEDFYGKWIYYDERIKEMPQSINYAANKTKMVAWFVSNCNARNGRHKYAEELAKYIEVDIYGKCGTKECPRSPPNICSELLRKEYKFYLSFENANCKHYITEKLFHNALGNNVLPIVMGARPEDYARYAPLNSYLHVEDFDSPKHLASYLKLLDADDEAYNSFFRWKGTGEVIDGTFQCRLCALLHGDRGTSGNGRFTSRFRTNEDVNSWWRGPGVCRHGTWKSKAKVKH